MELKENESIESLEIGDYKIIQDKNLYRFTSDSVILSKFAICKQGDVVADVCSGCGIVGLHTYALNEDKIKSVTLFELQSSLSDLAKRSVKLNGLENKFYFADGRLQDTYKNYNQNFSLILCNPPYKKMGGGEHSLSREIAICRHEIEITQAQILSCCYSLLRDGGRVCICQRVERFTEMINDMVKAKLNPSRVMFVSKSHSDKPYLFIMEAYKSVKRQFFVEPTWIN